jgi:hypothetical protein
VCVSVVSESVVSVVSFVFTCVCVGVWVCGCVGEYVYERENVYALNTSICEYVSEQSYVCVCVCVWRDERVYGSGCVSNGQRERARERRVCSVC